MELKCWKVVRHGAQNAGNSQEILGMLCIMGLKMLKVPRIPCGLRISHITETLLYNLYFPFKIPRQ